MDGDDDDLRYSYSTQFKHTVEQGNDQIITSIRNSSNIDTTFPKKTQMLTPNRRGVRVKFAYSSDNDRHSPITQTTVIKSEPCFKVIATEDEVTKHFYQSPREQKITQFVHRRILSEADSLEDEYSSKIVKERETTRKMTDSQHYVPDQATSHSPRKSILRKPQKKQEEKRSIPKLDRSLIPRSRSPSSSSKKKQTSSTHLNSNDVQHLAEITAKQKSSSPSIYLHSLFDQTINIFDPNNSYRITSNSPRPSRLQYYIKPYRGEANGPTNLNKQRSRSLPQNQLAQPSSLTTRWYTSSNQYARPSTRQSNRKQHISWSPLRENIHARRENQIIRPSKRNKILSDRTNSTLLSTVPSLPLTGPSFRNPTSIIPIPIYFRKSQSSQFPSPSSSTESYGTPSVSYRPLTSMKSVFQNDYNKDENESMLRSSLPDLVSQHKKEHDQTMQQYDRLLEKMRSTDKELQLLSRSWINNTTKQRTPANNNSSHYQQVRVGQKSNLLLKKTTTNSQFFSPMILQICLIILVIFNLFVVYFFNEINVWWNEHVAPALIGEQHDGEN